MSLQQFVTLLPLLFLSTECLSSLRNNSEHPLDRRAPGILAAPHSLSAGHSTSLQQFNLTHIVTSGFLVCGAFNVPTATHPTLKMGKFDHIPELTGASDFHAWKSQVILALGREGVYDHVSNGMDPLDYAEFASHLPTPKDPAAPTPAEQKHIREWLKEDAVAKDLVCRHLLPAVG